MNQSLAPRNMMMELVSGRVVAKPYTAIALLTVTYLALVQLVKVWFYRKHALM